MQASCQCGKVKFTTPIPEPLAVYICHCLECRAQSASAFGISIEYPHFSLPSALQSYISSWTRSSASGVTVKCYFCTVCGTRLLHENVLPDGTSAETVTVKGGCFGKELGSAVLNLDSAIHLWTKRAVVEVPEGAMAVEGDGTEDVIAYFTARQKYIGKYGAGKVGPTVSERSDDRGPGIEQ